MWYIYYKPMCGLKPIAEALIFSLFLPDNVYVQHEERLAIGLLLSKTSLETQILLFVREQSFPIQLRAPFSPFPQI